MSIPAAYLGVILIWSTTPLAIKWSGEGAGVLFGITARMAIGAALCVLLLALLRKPLVLKPLAIQLYLAGAIAGFGSMSLVYWGASYIPSGWISVLFGLTPIVSSLLALLFLRNESITAFRLLGMLLALFGLWRIFAGEHLELGEDTEWGISLVLLAVLLHSISAVWMQSLNRRIKLPALTITTGTLLIVVTLNLLILMFSGFQWPQQFQLRSSLSIIYLGIVGSVVGFMLYFYVMKHVTATQAGLITLISPVTALFLGAYFNAEVVGADVAWAAALILSGLALFQWGHRLRQLLR